MPISLSEQFFRESEGKIPNSEPRIAKNAKIGFFSPENFSLDLSRIMRTLLNPQVNDVLTDAATHSIQHFQLGYFFSKMFLGGKF